MSPIRERGALLFKQHTWGGLAHNIGQDGGPLDRMRITVRTDIFSVFFFDDTDLQQK